MKKRDLYSYNVILKHISEKVINYDVYIFTDFENALISSLKINFKYLKISGCYFHFTQIIWRKIKQLNMQLDYKNDYNFRKMVRLIMLLSYVPREKVYSEFEKIKKLYQNDEKTFKF
ncbi:hypothetical protein DMUE_3799 [Dictyocoela muelleri]|nr:hypothetical protein DMUE_3799 [Dictyocoela muelleri]